MPLRIVLVVVLAIVLRAVVHRAISRVVRRAILTPTVPEALRQRLGEPPSTAAERRRQRAETVGSVLKSMTSIVIAAVTVATVLGELDVDLRPVLASAGILGVALGFGAQNLVKDWLSGIFMILEDQLGVGDAVDVGEASGIVESVGLRTTRMRSVDGTVWHVRNGEILRVGNMSQGWSRALVDVSIAYGTDVDHAQAVIKRVADEVWRDEDLGEFVLDEPEVWGVEQLGPEGIAIRLVVKTAPLEQWKVARELRRRLKEAFDAEGIEIPFPQRSVWLRTSPDGPASPVLPGAASRPAKKAGARTAKRPATKADAPTKAVRRPDGSRPTGEADAMRSDALSTGALRMPDHPAPPEPPRAGRRNR